MGSACGLFFFLCRVVLPYKSHRADCSKIQLSSLVDTLLPSHEPMGLEGSGLKVGSNVFV